jgi:hypothetical protein
MSKSPEDRFPFAKIITFFAVSFGVGLGLCGLSGILASHGIDSGDSREEFSTGIVGKLSFIVIVFSGLGLVVTTVACVVSGILNSIGFGHGKDEPQKLFEDTDEEDKSS